MIPGYRPTLNVYTPRYSKCDNFGSSIINQKHFALFASWIDRKVKNSMYIKDAPYEFNRILRASWNGYDAASFHDKCNNKGANIVVIKIKNSNQIVGGYNPLDWNGVGWKNTADSFIFSFDNYKNSKTGKFGKVINTQRAVQSDPKKGPIFGSELSVNNNRGFSYVRNFYPDIDIPQQFIIENYEVFQIKKKNMKHSPVQCCLV
ncbi:hypothetical protein C1645_761019 [Glomus cerebriforme]|uniref:TLDc domain-containing protein n=1 Tax=Glomus cerebriforme TaxID=658196 RepID=A0A397TC85_9GLOM|nr:hypothetical protein C1645_761019 [Glomus cerebriforme]